jgi:hypothetical protein
MEQLLFGLSSLGIFSALPLIVSVVAVVDAFRVGAPCYWIWIIFAFPIVGAAAYFFVVRQGSVRIPISLDASRRVQARRRLRELQVQLNHWRGPAILAEAGEELLVLGRHQEAERHFREARENGAGVDDVNFGLAQALQMQRRYAEAVPLLEELVKTKPDACMGRAQLQLGRSLDESGQKGRAEEVLRDLLERRPILEAQVRLARLLMAKGEKEEARALLAEVKSDAACLPRYLRRQHRSWIWTARTLSSGSARLPRPYVEGGPRPGHRLRMGLTAAGAAAVIVLLFLYGSWQLQVQANAYSEAAEASQEEASQAPATGRR